MPMVQKERTTMEIPGYLDKYFVFTEKEKKYLTVMVCPGIPKVKPSDKILQADFTSSPVNVRPV